MNSDAAPSSKTYSIYQHTLKLLNTGETYEQELGTVFCRVRCLKRVRNARREEPKIALVLKCV